LQGKRQQAGSLYKAGKTAGGGREIHRKSRQNARVLTRKQRGREAREDYREVGETDRGESTT
jgi:hypothetical protein